MTDAAARETIVAEGDLTSHLWRFGRTPGQTIADRLRFIPDGRIIGSTSANERRWRLHEGGLDLMTATGTITTTFATATMAGGRPRLTGTFWPSPQVEHTLTKNLDDLHTVRWLRRPSAPVLVIFNSRGAPFDGDITVWTATHVTKQQKHDYVLISERVDPHFWYLNKVARLMRLFDAMIVEGYSELYIYGQSSGGFAALYFGELIAAIHPHCRVRTAAINPQTVHGRQYEEVLRDVVLPNDDYAFIEEDALAQVQGTISDIPTLVRHLGDNRGHAEHRVIYDSGNPCDAIYCGLLDGLPGFHLMPQALGRHHSDGITLIRQSPLFDEALAWGLGG